MAGRMYLGNQMVTPAITSIVESVNGQTGDVVLDASDVGALPDTTRYAKTLGLSMNTTTYILSWQLYDQNGDAIGEVQTVDLPLESVVVNGTYDSVNKKIVLTLQNGSTIDVPVGDLVSGLQSEITITNMLSSDLVDDTNHTHKFVTSEEKTTWNNKQDAINDLATIRSGASAGATAVQPPAIANMQTTDNIVQTIRASASAETTKYPSEKAVALKADGLATQIAKEKSDRIAMDNTLSDRIDDLDEYVSDSLDSFVKTTDTIPITDYSLLNVPVQYRGQTTQDYINGYFYRFTNPVYSSSVTIQTGSFTVTIDNAKFISRFLKTGIHRFWKNSGYWYNPEVGEIYNLSYYGITISGTVNTDDEFYVDINMSTTVTRIDVQPAGGGGGAVDSVNGQTGIVVLDAEDVGAVDEDVFLGPYYGTCSTGASVADKVVSCPELPDFSSSTETIKDGTTINVKFTNGQSIDDGAIKLNVNNYGLITVKAYYSYLPYNAWRAGDVVSFVYDGYYWQLVSPEWVWVASDLEDEIDARIDAVNDLSDALSNEVSRAKGAEQRIEGLIPTQASDIGAVAANTAITGATKCKITYDSKGLVTAGADLASNDITTALGYTPYNSTNPSGYQENVIETVNVNGTALTPSSKAVNITVPTNNNQLANGAGYITSSALGGYATEQWVGQQGYLTGITSSDVTTALGYTPYNSSNPNGYTSNVGTVTSVNNVSPTNGNVTLSIPTDTSDLTNDAGFITSSALSGYQTTANLVTSVSSSSTDSQYPSAKLFYDTCGDIETLINAL